MSGDWRLWFRRIYDAARELGFAPRATEFVEASVDDVYQAAAYGLPGTYPHWTFGRDYWRLKQLHESGRQRIYELIVNTRPAVAYLLRHNTFADQIYVIAHMCLHSDFFDRNAHMRSVRPDIDTYLAAASDRIRAYEHEYGTGVVEDLLSVGHALRWNVQEPVPAPEAPPRPPQRRDRGAADLDGLGVPPAERLMNETLAQQEWRQAVEQVRLGCPCPDPLYYLIRFGPLEDWQRDVLTTVRAVGLALAPQAATKLMDEGWAVWGSLKVLRALDLPQEVHWPEAALHAAVVHPDPLLLNPYWLGERLWDHLERQGADVRAICAVETDVSFLRNWVDRDFVCRERLYRWHVEEEDAAAATVRRYTVDTRRWEAVRDQLIDLWTPRQPQIRVVHRHANGTLRLAADMEVDERDARVLLGRIAALWRNPVRLVAPRGEDADPQVLEAAPDVPAEPAGAAGARAASTRGRGGTPNGT